MLTLIELKQHRKSIYFSSIFNLSALTPLLSASSPEKSLLVAGNELGSSCSLTNSANHKTTSSSTNANFGQMLCLHFLMYKILWKYKIGQMSHYTES